MGWCSLDFYQKIEADEKVRKMGFEICEWPPEPDDKCEKCGKERVQMYWSGDGHGEGTYWCKRCIIDLFDQNEKDAKEHELAERCDKIRGKG